MHLFLPYGKKSSHEVMLNLQICNMSVQLTSSFEKGNSPNTFLVSGERHGAHSNPFRMKQRMPGGPGCYVQKKKFFPYKPSVMRSNMSSFAVHSHSFTLQTLTPSLSHSSQISVANMSWKENSISGRVMMGPSSRSSPLRALSLCSRAWQRWHI